MSEWTPTRRKVQRFLFLAFFLLMAAKLAIEIPADQGWTEGESLLALARRTVFFLNVLVAVVIGVSVLLWPVATRYGGAGRTLMLVGLGMFVLGAAADQLGFLDWLERQGRIATIAFTAISTLTAMGLLLALVVVSVLDLQEQTNRDIRTRLHGKGPSDKQSGAVAEASRPELEPEVEKTRAK